MIYLYELICPIRKDVCYVGLTVNPTNRLRQHITDCERYKTKIAKYVRHLKRKGEHERLQMVLIKSCQDQAEASEAERQRIKLRRLQGKKIYNQLDGGYEQAPAWSRKTVDKLISEGRLFGGHKECEDMYQAIFTNDQILFMYGLFKQFYSNKEIIKMMNLDVYTNTITAIRKGVNWKSLWVQHFDEPIECPSVLSEWLTARDKLLITYLSTQGYTVSDVRAFYPELHTSDYRRAKDRKIWTKVWNFYDKHPDLSKKIINEMLDTLTI